MLLVVLDTNVFVSAVRSQIPASSKRGLPEMHSNTLEDVVEPIKDEC